MSRNFEEIFNNSYERVSETHLVFFERFYENFLVVPGIAEKFLDTDFKHQQLMLRRSLLNMVEFSIRGREDNNMKNLAQNHNQRNIPSELYDVWLDALILTVRQCDAEFSPDVELAWRVILASGLSYMKASARMATQTTNTERVT